MQHWSKSYTQESEMISELACSDDEGKGVGKEAKGKHCQNWWGDEEWSKRRRIHFLQLVLFFFLLPIFFLCFSIPFLRDWGKAKVVFHNGAVKIEEEVPVQLQFSQVKHFACFLKTSISYSSFLKAWNGTRRSNVFCFVPCFQQRLGQAEVAIFTSDDVSVLGYLAF